MGDEETGREEVRWRPRATPFGSSSGALGPHPTGHPAASAAGPRRPRRWVVRRRRRGVEPLTSRHLDDVRVVRAARPRRAVLHDAERARGPLKQSAPRSGRGGSTNGRVGLNAGARYERARALRRAARARHPGARRAGARRTRRARARPEARAHLGRAPRRRLGVERNRLEERPVARVGRAVRREVVRARTRSGRSTCRRGTRRTSSGTRASRARARGGYTHGLSALSETSRAGHGAVGPRARPRSPRSKW